MSGPALDAFIAENIRSVEEIEILVLLFRSPETFWTADAMAQHLELKVDVVAARARDLVRRGLLRPAESGPAFRYAPARLDIHERVADLLSAYGERRISIINTIYSASLERLRSFSDAFKLDGGEE